MNKIFLARLAVFFMISPIFSESLHNGFWGWTGAIVVSIVCILVLCFAIILFSEKTDSKYKEKESEFYFLAVILPILSIRIFPGAFCGIYGSVLAIILMFAVIFNKYKIIDGILFSNFIIAVLVVYFNPWILFFNALIIGLAAIMLGKIHQFNPKKNNVYLVCFSLFNILFLCISKFLHSFSWIASIFFTVCWCIFLLVITKTFF